MLIIATLLTFSFELLNTGNKVLAALLLTIYIMLIGFLIIGSVLYTSFKEFSKLSGLVELKRALREIQINRLVKPEVFEKD